MEENKDKNIEAIAKLISLTRDDKLRWTSVVSTAILATGDDVIDSVFTARYKDKDLRVYRRKYKGPSLVPNIAVIFSGSGKSAELRWYTEVVLELIDPLGSSLWIFPKEEILKDLLKTIKYKVSGAQDLINSLLSE